MAPEHWSSADIDPSLTLLEALHRRWVIFWRTLPEESWVRTGVNPESGPVTLFDQLRGYDAHGEGHLDQISRTLASHRELAAVHFVSHAADGVLRLVRDRDESARLGRNASHEARQRFDVRVAVSPGIGFGNHGEGYVRFALVENEQRIMQAVRGIRKLINS